MGHDDEDGHCDVCGRDLNAQIETVHVILIDGVFPDGTSEKDIEVGGIAYISPVEKEGKTFEGWYINGQKVSGEATARIVITEACTIEARYTDNGGEPIVPPTPDDDKKKGGLPAGAIVGIVIGAVLLVAAGGFCIYWFIIRKKKKVA